MNCRAIDTQELIGNIGGYIGLCLGYSLLQIPELLLALFRKTNKFYLAMGEKASENIVPNSRVLVVAEYQSPERETTAVYHSNERNAAEKLNRDNKIAVNDGFESVGKLTLGTNKSIERRIENLERILLENEWSMDRRFEYLEKLILASKKIGAREQKINNK